MSTRSLFRAAASERRAAGSAGIQDPFASYSSATGALRCSACNHLAIKHESLWASHASSKSHRANVARIRAETEAAESRRQSQGSEGKRKADDDGIDGRGDDEDGDGGIDSKRFKTDAQPAAEEELDPEWEAFQRELAQAESSAQSTSGPAAAEDAAQAQYANATVEVQPILTNAPDSGDAKDGEQTNGDAGNTEETEAERRARLEQEEREEIYSRYEEEQRIQDEAEERVSALKLKLEKIKAARLAKKQQQGKTKKDGASSTAAPS